MKVLITGATGLIGKKVCHELVCRKHELVIMSRDPEKASARLKLPATKFKWDALTDSFPLLALSHVSAIVHLAGEPIAERFWSKAEREQIMKSRVLGSAAIAAALAEMPADQRPKTLVAASATGFYGDHPGDDWLTESSARGTGFLSDVCTAWEQESARAGAFCERSVIVRIGVVLARDGGALQRMVPVFRRGFGAVFGTGQNWFSWIHITDLVRLICDAVEKPAFAGVTNAVSPQPVWQSEFARELNQALGRKRLWKIPAPLLRFGLGEMSEFMLGSARVKPERAQGAGFTFEFESLGSALKDLIGS